MIQTTPDTFTHADAVLALLAIDTARKLMTAEMDRLRRRRLKSSNDLFQIGQIAAALATLQPLVEALKEQS